MEVSKAELRPYMVPVAVAFVFLTIFFFLLLGATAPRETLPSMPEIKAACERHYGIETQAAAACQLSTVVALADEDNRRRQNRVRAELGL